MSRHALPRRGFRLPRLTLLLLAAAAIAGCEILAGPTELGPDAVARALKRGDQELAWRLTEPLALNGNYESQARLAVMHAQGMHVARDLEEAMYWAELSNRGGFILAPNIVKDIARSLPAEKLKAAVARADAFKVTPMPAGYWEWRAKVEKGEAGSRDAPWLLANQAPASAPVPTPTFTGADVAPLPAVAGEAPASSGPVPSDPAPSGPASPPPAPSEAVSPAPVPPTAQPVAESTAPPPAPPPSPALAGAVVAPLPAAVGDAASAAGSAPAASAAVEGETQNWWGRPN